MKTTNFRTVEELNLDANAPMITPTKVQNDKIVRALKKLSFTNPDETSIVKIVSAFVALGVNPQAKSSSWLARRLKKHLQSFGLVGTAPEVAQESSSAVAQEPVEAVAQGPSAERSAAKQQEMVAAPAAVEAAKVKTKKPAPKKE
jgi:UDP-N-acetyl-D-mannosaminuronic acid transferase (WecB/TagA/CpsF family)